MDLSSSGDKRNLIFISFHEEDKDLLNKLVHFNLRSEASRVNAIRQRRLLESEAELWEAVKRAVEICYQCEPAPLRRPIFEATWFFTLLMSRANYESFIGDLEERYAAILKTQGHRSARRWFWRQVFQSLVPLVIAAVRRVSGFESLMEFYRRKRS